MTNTKGTIVAKLLKKISFRFTCEKKREQSLQNSKNRIIAKVVTARWHSHFGSFALPQSNNSFLNVVLCLFVSALTCLLFNHLLWARCASESNLHNSVAYDQEGSSRLIIFRDFLIALSIIASPPPWPSPYLFHLVVPLLQRHSSYSYQEDPPVPVPRREMFEEEQQIMTVVGAIFTSPLPLLKCCGSLCGSGAFGWSGSSNMHDPWQNKKNKHVVVTKIKASHGLSSRLLSKALFFKFCNDCSLFFPTVANNAFCASFCACFVAIRLLWSVLLDLQFTCMITNRDGSIIAAWQNVFWRIYYETKGNNRCKIWKKSQT